MSAEHEAWEVQRSVQGGEEIEMLRRASKDGAFRVSVAGQIDRERRVVALQVSIDVVPVCRAVEGAVHQEYEPAVWSINTGSRREPVVHPSLSDLY